MKIKIKIKVYLDRYQPTKLINLFRDSPLVIIVINHVNIM